MDTVIPAIRASNLTKHFGSICALDGMDLDVQRGEFFGLLGPNGAGKTTTIRILTGLSRPDKGRAWVDGIDCSTNPKAVQERIGVVPDESNLYPELTGYENLCFCGALYGLRRKERHRRALELLEVFGLSGAAHRPFGSYSKGMKRRLTIAAAIVHNPKILFLDEPTTGIDVASARQVRKLMAQLHAAGTTILLTTHYIEEAERLCERVAFLVQGRIVRTDSLDNLLAPVQGRSVLEIVAHPISDALLGDLESQFQDIRCRRLGRDRFHVESEAPLPLGSIVRTLEARGLSVAEARRRRPSLEEIFVETTGIEARMLERPEESAP